MKMELDLMFVPIDRNDPDVFATEETLEGCKVKYIALDNEPESPRQCDNLGTMVCFHKRYILGDEEHGYRSETFNSWDELKSAIEENGDIGVILPLYLYDHSGITMGTCPFNDRWDSGQVGFIFVSKDKIREEFSIKDTDITDEILDKAKNVLKSEVEIYDYYLRGEVYRLIVEIFDKDKEQTYCDIVGGFYGIKCAKEELKTF